MSRRVLIAFALALAGAIVLWVGCSGTPASAPVPVPAPSSTPDECSTIGHKHLVFAATKPQITSTAIIEAFDRDAIDTHVRAASVFAASTWGYDDQPAIDLATAAQTYWAALKTAQGEYDIDERISFKNAEAAYQALVEVRESYRVFARLTCKPDSGW